jgi:glycerophosphoryl diester phosphodiesterase
MPPGSTTRSLLDDTLGSLRGSWKSLVVTDIAFKILAFVLLTPLMGVLFRTLLAASGSEVVSDFDIAMFFLGPLGWLCSILVGAIWLGIIALELASLMAVMCAKDANLRLGALGAIRFSSAGALPIIQVTARIVAWTLLASAPFLAIAAVIYFRLLTEFDINYYLQEMPPVFRVSVGIGAILLIGLTSVLLRLYSGWLFALPLVLFEEVRPAEALRLSAERTHGHRRTLLLWIVGWGLVMTLLSALTTAIVGLVGRMIVPEATASLQFLAVAVGLVLLLWFAVGLAVNLLSTTSFAAMLFNLYRQLGHDGSTDLRLPGAAKAISGTGLKITRQRLIVAAVVGVLLAIAIGVFALQSVRLQDDVEIMAHRGSSKAAPENTLASIQKAIDEGADWVEIDVQETADGEVVVLHDSDFMKLAGRNLKIWDATLDDLKDIDIGSWFAPEFRDQRVPTLAEVLDLCKGKIRVNIELKYYGHDQQLEQRVADIVRSREMDSQVVAMSLKMDAVRKMKSIRPNWRVGLLMSVSAGDLSKIEADFLAVNAGFVHRGFVRRVHDAEKEVFVWTVNDALAMSNMIGRGVDGLLTDKPALARRVLEERAKMSAPQRLLLELAELLGVPVETAEQ